MASRAIAQGVIPLGEGIHEVPLEASDHGLVIEVNAGRCSRNVGDTIPFVTREDLLAAALKLPLERAALADGLLRSLELPEPERKKLWLEVADRRLAEMREGRVREIPADEVFARGRSVTSR